MIRHTRHSWARVAALILVGAMLAACGNAGTAETATTVAEAPTTTTTVAETTTTVIETTTTTTAPKVPTEEEVRKAVEEQGEAALRAFVTETRKYGAIGGNVDATHLGGAVLEYAKASTAHFNLRWNYWVSEGWISGQPIQFGRILEPMDASSVRPLDEENGLYLVDALVRAENDHYLHWAVSDFVVTVEGNGLLKIVDLVVTSWQPKKWAYWLSDMLLDVEETDVKIRRIDGTEVPGGKVLYAWYEAYRDYRDDLIEVEGGQAHGTTRFNAVIELSEPVNLITDEEYGFNSTGGSWHGQRTGATLCDPEECYLDFPTGEIETTSPANAKVLPITSFHRLEEHVTQPNRFLRPVMHGQGDGAMLSQLIVEIPAWEPENLCANPDGEFCHDFSEQIPNG